MKNYAILTAAMLTLFSWNAGSAAEPASLDELLRSVEQARVREGQENQQREARFAAAKSEQQRLLSEARAERAALEQRSQALEEQFEVNEDEIADLTLALDTQLGALKELFGVLQQTAGDTRGIFENSLTNIEYPERLQFLDALGNKMGQTSELASMEDIERLWYELMREAREAGKIVRFSTPVVTAQGDEETREVVRVGAFNVVSAGKYLKYVPETGKVVELIRQPEQGRFTRSTSRILKADEGLVKFGVDSTRGQILAALVQRPNLTERIQQGGIVGYVIILLGLIALAIAVERLIVLTIASNKVRQQMSSSQPQQDNPLGRVLAVADENRGVDSGTLELKLGEAILKETPQLNRSLLFLKIIAVVAPLLGLLGTVTGMIKTFQAITLFGTGDPKLMAGGISQALVTTVLGLTVAIPTVLLHTLVSTRSRRIIHVLQEQSAGIIAERSEVESHKG